MLGNGMPTDGWSLTVGQLTRIFNVAYPKILGRIWSQSGEVDEQRFLNDPTYRKEQIEFFGNIEVPEAMALEVDTESRQVFILTDKGLHLPWPANYASDYIDYVYRKYADAKPKPMISVPGVFVANVVADAPLLEEKVPPPSSEPKRDDIVPRYREPNYAWYIYGTDYQKLVDFLPLFVADMWSAGNAVLYAACRDSTEASKNLFIERLLQDLEGETGNHDIKLAGRIHDVVIANGAGEFSITNPGEFSITEKGLVVPFPRRPTAEELYTSWSQGESGIPTFTYTPS